MRIDVSGDLVISHAGRSWSPTAAADRKFLAELVAHAGRTVSTDHLVETMWPQRRPAQPANAVQIRASRLRRALRDLAPQLPTDEVLRTAAAGYELRTESLTIDILTFRAALAEAATVRRDGAPERAADAYAEAIAAWRPGPFDTAPQTWCVAAETARLEESYLAAVEEHAELCAATGRPVAVDAAELRRLVDAHPLRERLLGALIVGLAARGERAAALAAYRNGRRRLVDDLGLEPGPALRELHAAVLRGEFGTGPIRATPEPPAAFCLPRELPDFTGRDRDLRRLVDAVESAGTELLIVGGLAGVGKTSLAVRAAHRLAARHPDGQLYVDLNGYTAGCEPTEPAAALRLLLLSLGVPPARIPDGLEARAARWRAELAGRRVLLLLDNAVSADQVRPLLPGMPGCTVLVTARAILTGLDGAVPVPLAELPAEESVALLGAVAGTERVRAEPAAAARLAELCGHLPLALRLVGARLRSRPGWRVEDAVARFHGDRVGLLHSGPHPVATAFTLSLRDLDPCDVRVFELASLAPGATFGADLAAAAAGVPNAAAEGALERLVDAYLLEEPVAGRYRFHDLVRDYARDRTVGAGAQRRAAVARMLDQYLATSAVAVSRLGPRARPLPFHVPTAPARAPRLDGLAAAAAWLDTEHGNLSAAVEYAEATGHDRRAWQLAQALYRYYLVGSHTGDWIRVNEAALRAARRLGNRRAEGLTLLDLGIAEGLRGRAGQALAHLRRALGLLRAARDVRAVDQTLLALANVHTDQCRYPEAIAYYQRIVQRCDNRRGGRMYTLALGNLGLLLGRIGRYREARGYHRRALRAARATGDHLRRCHELANLADIDLRLGRVDTARERYGKALRLARSYGDHAGEVHALAGLAVAYRRLGRLADAIDLHQQALRLRRRADNPGSEANLLNAYALTNRQAGREAEADRLYRDALRLAADGENPYEEAVALRGLAVHAAPEVAAGYRARADEIFARLGVPPEGEPPPAAEESRPVAPEESRPTGRDRAAPSPVAA